MTIYVGIDPGKDGAIAFIFPNGVVEFLKTKDEEKNNFKNVPGFLALSDDYLAVIEAVHALGFVPASTNFILGFSKGFWTGFLKGFNIEPHYVNPLEWQNKVTKPPPKILFSKLLNPKLLKKAKADHKKNIKNASKEAANFLYPGYNIKHDGVSDAICMAHWLKLKHEGGDFCEEES